MLEASGAESICVENVRQNGNNSSANRTENAVGLHQYVASCSLCYWAVNWHRSISSHVNLPLDSQGALITVCKEVGKQQRCV